MVEYLLCVVVAQLAFGFYFIVAAIKNPKQSQKPRPWDEASRALVVGGLLYLILKGVGWIILQIDLDLG